MKRNVRQTDVSQRPNAVRSPPDCAVAILDTCSRPNIESASGESSMSTLSGCKSTGCGHAPCTELRALRCERTVAECDC
eukprot:5294267-Alexandrium_andersonii.AAC.1